jgi:hypothetical protein
MVGKQESDNRLYFRLARGASAVGNGKQRKARSAGREPHDYYGRPAFIENGFVARVRAVGVVYWSAFTSITACL